MFEDAVADFLELERGLDVAYTQGPDLGKTLFVSLNPDLVAEFGHYLNYEIRLREVCVQHGFDYACLANEGLQVQARDLFAHFAQDSGSYSLTRASAAGGEQDTAGSFFATVSSGVTRVVGDRDYSRIVIFLYCGSSLLASRVSHLPWASNVTVCINAFYDFLLPSQYRDYKHLIPLKFSTKVRVLAMSDSHAASIREKTGLFFDHIPNPTPLGEDQYAYDAIRRTVIGEAIKCDSEWLTVLVPGLMTEGKGKTQTIELVAALERSMPTHCRFVFRDRRGDALSSNTPNIDIITGDLGAQDVVELYLQADFTLLPYEADTFAERTSGALADCFVLGAIPIVVEGTWLASTCRKYGVGVVLPDAGAETVIDAIREGRREIGALRRKLAQAGAAYLRDNSWGHLLRIVLGDGHATAASCSGPVLGRHDSMLAVANALFRAGNYRGAAKIYNWLADVSDWWVYRSNLEMCIQRSGLSVDTLIDEAGESMP